MSLIQEIGYNKDTDIELGTVVKALPDIEIQIDGFDLLLDKDDVILAERLCDHTLVTSTGELDIKSPLKVGDRVLVASVRNNQLFIILDKAVTM